MQILCFECFFVSRTIVFLSDNVLFNYNIQIKSSNTLLKIRFCLSFQKTWSQICLRLISTHPWHWSLALVKFPILKCLVSECEFQKCKLELSLNLVSCFYFNIKGLLFYLSRPKLQTFSDQTQKQRAVIPMINSTKRIEIIFSFFLQTVGNTEIW